MTSADIIMNFMFDLPLCCPPTQIANVRRYRMDKARVWSKQNTRGKYWNGATNPVPQERIKNDSCRAAGKGLLTSKFGRQLRMNISAVEIDPKFRDAAYFAVRRENGRKVGYWHKAGQANAAGMSAAGESGNAPAKEGSGFDPKRA